MNLNFDFSYIFILLIFIAIAIVHYFKFCEKNGKFTKSLIILSLIFFVIFFVYHICHVYKQNKNENEIILNRGFTDNRAIHLFDTISNHPMIGL